MSTDSSKNRFIEPLPFDSRPAEPSSDRAPGSDVGKHPTTPPASTIDTATGVSADKVRESTVVINRGQRQPKAAGRAPKPRGALRAVLLLSNDRVLEVVFADETVRFVIGRDRHKCDLVAEDPRVSRTHAALRQINGLGYVEDLGSANGTYVNGARIGSLHRLHDGDRVRVGQTEFSYRCQG